MKNSWALYIVWWWLSRSGAITRPHQEYKLLSHRQVVAGNGNRGQTASIFNTFLFVFNCFPHLKAATTNSASNLQTINHFLSDHLTVAVLYPAVFVLYDPNKLSFQMVRSFLYRLFDFYVYFLYTFFNYVSSVTFHIFKKNYNNNNN